jgi:hypothetical protein
VEVSSSICLQAQVFWMTSTGCIPISRLSAHGRVSLEDYSRAASCLARVKNSHTVCRPLQLFAYLLSSPREDKTSRGVVMLCAQIAAARRGLAGHSKSGVHHAARCRVFYAAVVSDACLSDARRPPPTAKGGLPCATCGPHLNMVIIRPQVRKQLGLRDYLDSSNTSDRRTECWCAANGGQ